MLNASLSSTFAPVVGGGQARRRAAAVMQARCARRRSIRRRIQRSSAPPLTPRPTTAGPRSLSSRRRAKEPVQDRLCRHGDPAVARRDGLRRRSCSDARHDRGRQGDHPAADRRTTRRLRPSSRMPTRTGCSPGRRGSRRCARSRRCAGSAGRATTSPGPISRPKPSSCASRTRSSTSSAPTRCSRTRCRSIRRSPKPPRRRTTQYPAEQMTEGWIAGMVVEAALKAPAGRRTPPSSAAAMENLKVDTKGLRGGPIEWTKDQPLPHHAVLPRLPLGRGQERGRSRQGLDGLRREIAAYDPGVPLAPAAGRACLSLPASSTGSRKNSCVQLAVNIVVLAAIYALIACGYVLIYRVSRVLNLAHGELMMLGAYLLLTDGSLFAGHPLVAIAAAVVLSAARRRPGLPVPDAQDDRRDGARRGAHHRRARHPAARR